MTLSNAQLYAGAAIILGVLGAICALGIEKVLTNAEAFGALMAIITIGGSILGVHVGVKAALTAPAVRDPNTPR
jgi:hypothetical protein